jgi:hypothetical protein
VAFLPGTAVVLAVVLWRHRRDRQAWIRLGAAVAVFSVLAVPAAIQLRVTATAFDVLQRTGGPPTTTVGFVPWLWSIDVGYWQMLFHSFWGQFGWLEYALDARWFTWLYAVATGFWAGLVVALATRRWSAPWWTRRGVAFAAGTLVSMFLFILLTEWHARAHIGIVGVIQGRNFLSALPALAILAIVGLAAWVPQRLRPAVGALVVTGAAILNVAALLWIVRFHHGHG